MLKRIFPRGLMARALLIVLGPFLIMQVLSSYVFYENHWDQVGKQLARDLAGDVAMLIDVLSQSSGQEEQDSWLRKAGRLFDLAATIEDGGVLPETPKELTQLEGELRRALFFKGVSSPFRIDSQSIPGVVVIALQLPEGILHIAAPRDRLFSPTVYAFIWMELGLSLLLLGVAALFMRNQVRPVRHLARVAEAFGKGREDAEFRPDGALEVKMAGYAFLAMRNRIQRQINQRTIMLAGVSHDLRTPLTRMKLQLELMPPSDAVKDLKDDVSQMERMLAGYLAFAKGEGTERPESSDISELVIEAVNQARRKSGERIELITCEQLIFPVRRDALSRCLANLLENAARCAQHVRVQVMQRGRAVEIVIDDDGQGIPAHQREDVFRPFFRLEGSRNPNTGGVGLGLTIARDVARGHGGDVYLEDSPMKGLRVRLRLPL